MITYLLLLYPQHNRQLDPTEIVLIPYDLSRLWLHVAMVAFFYTTTTSHLRKNLPVLLGMTACTWVAYIIYGASPMENLWHTLAAALYLMILVQWDPALLLDRETGQLVSSSSLNVLERLSLAASSSRAAATSAVDRLAMVQTQAVVGATIVLHILRLYDGGWQPQRWPVPTILGATVGWIVGRWIGLVTMSTASGQLQPSSDKGSL